MSASTAVPISSAPRRAYSTVEVGFLLFLASEVMFFAGLFAAAIVLRSADPRWGSGSAHLSRGAGIAGMGLLLLGSYGLVRATSRAVPTVRELCVSAALAVVFGAAFLGLAAWEYRALLAARRDWTCDVFSSCFWGLTGVHALHVLAGLVWLAWLAARGGADAVALRARTRLAAWYWNLVDAVWIALYLFFYLL
ncbi:MAG: heme-copper oxidase subunit III [Planctomycetes bacterium]|nr:heme-copper oxidase subunit III [Planctomycetota bacterium]